MTKCLHFPVAAPRRGEGGTPRSAPRVGAAAAGSSERLGHPRERGRRQWGPAGTLRAGAARAGAGGPAALLAVAETCRCFWRRGWGSTKRNC